jgi:hypothetical protein
MRTVNPAVVSLHTDGGLSMDRSFLDAGQGALPDPRIKLASAVGRAIPHGVEEGPSARAGRVFGAAALLGVLTR